MPPGEVRQRMEDFIAKFILGGVSASPGSFSTDTHVSFGDRRPKGFA